MQVKFQTGNEIIPNVLLKRYERNDGWFPKYTTPMERYSTFVSSFFCRCISDTRPSLLFDLLGIKFAWANTYFEWFVILKQLYKQKLISVMCVKVTADFWSKSFCEILSKSFNKLTAELLLQGTFKMDPSLGRHHKDQNLYKLYLY